MVIGHTCEVDGESGEVLTNPDLGRFGNNFWEKKNEKWEQNQKCCDIFNVFPV